MIERHFDYVIRLASLANNAIHNELVLGMDSDAPFVLRALGGYSITGSGTSEETTANIPALLRFRFADADTNWLQTARTPGLLTQPSPTDYVPLRKHVMYPARGAFRYQLENVSGGTLTDLVIILRGVKLFPGRGADSPVYAPTYPDCYAPETFQYALNFSLAAGAVQLNQPLLINDDADFAWRGSLLARDTGVASSSLGGLEVRVRDTLAKAYSSEGSDGGQGSWIRATRLWSETPHKPGLWYPEVYLQKSHAFVCDMRNVLTVGTAAGQMTLEGSKIFHKVRV